MGDAKTKDKARCGTRRWIGSTEYQCEKNEGHRHEFGNEECVASARAYANEVVDWQSIVLNTKPLLEWCVANEPIVGREKAENARCLLVKIYMSLTPRPGVAKTKS